MLAVQVYTLEFNLGGCKLDFGKTYNEKLINFFTAHHLIVEYCLLYILFVNTIYKYYLGSHHTMHFYFLS